MEDGTVYTAHGEDIGAIYYEYQTVSIRFSKLIYSSVYQTPLLRQNVPCVCQVCHEKTISNLSTLKDKRCISEVII